MKNFVVLLSFLFALLFLCCFGKEHSRDDGGTFDARVVREKQRKNFLEIAGLVQRLKPTAWSGEHLLALYDIMDSLQFSENNTFLNRIVSIEAQERTVEMKILLQSLKEKELMPWKISVDQVSKKWKAVEFSVDEKKFLKEEYGYHNGIIRQEVRNGSDGIVELLALSEAAHCEHQEYTGWCIRGTVKSDPYVLQTLQFQQTIQMDLPLNQATFLSSHNSFNNKADGYGEGDFLLAQLLELISGGHWNLVWAQQWFSMTDQLNMGVRQMMLDPVWFFDEMRLCHCGTRFPWFDTVLGYLEYIFNSTLDFDSSDLGCSPYDRTFESGLVEIFHWLQEPQNKEEIIFILVNDESHSADWGHQAIIRKYVQKIFNGLLFTPAMKHEKFPNTWPTRRQLLEMGTRVMVYGPRISNDHIFSDITHPSWDANAMKHLAASPYPVCSNFSAEFFPRFTTFGGESQVVGPIYNGPKEEGLIIKENFQTLLDCGINIPSMDLASPGLISSAIWTWMPGELEKLKASNGSLCTAMITAPDSPFKGRWITANCDQTLPSACQSISQLYSWDIGMPLAAWGSGQCPSGFSFQVPTNSQMNRKIRDALQNPVEKVWLNYVHTTTTN